MKPSAQQIKALATAQSNGIVVVGRDVAGNTFASLVKAGLLTRYSDGVPCPEFSQWVVGAVGYLTPAGRAAATR